MLPKKYQPNWKYHATKKAVLIKSQAHEDALMKQGGWEDSPAKHGVVTHPHSEEYLAHEAGEIDDKFEGVDYDEAGAEVEPVESQEMEPAIGDEEKPRRGRPKKG